MVRYLSMLASVLFLWRALARLVTTTATLRAFRGASGWSTRCAGAWRALCPHDTIRVPWIEMYTFVPVAGSTSAAHVTCLTVRRLRLELAVARATTR